MLVETRTMIVRGDRDYDIHFVLSPVVAGGERADWTRIDSVWLGVLKREGVECGGGRNRPVT